ncbi:MAG TPA: hypothetical protein VF117_03290, partial [Gammaproteobacteria bacterium]
TAIPAGRYDVVINDKMKDGTYGSLHTTADVQLSRLNVLPPMKLATINTNTPYVTVSSHEAQAIFPDNALTLDLSQARLIFADTGRESGNLHLDFQTAGQFSYPVAKGAMPQWLYSLQPSGVAVQGSVGITIEMPALYGSYSYVPQDGTLVVMLGYDPDTQTIEPVGVGTISGHTITSVGSLPLQNLDYIGYAIVNTASQTILTDYRDGKITSLGQLRSALGEGQ